MAVGLLWGSFVLLLLMLALNIALELRKKENEAQVEPMLLIFLENSEEICEGVLRQICYGPKIDKVWGQVVVIDHYSTDHTAAIVSRLQLHYSEIELLIRGERNTLIYRRLEGLSPKGYQVLDLRDFKRVRDPMCIKSIAA